MRATLLHNPTAGQKAEKDDILAALRLADIDARYVSIKEDDVESALQKRADLIIIAGGDGTVAEILIKLPDRSVPVALLPLGTANNIARSFGIAGTPQELVETWKLDHFCPVDIGAVKAPWGTSRFLEGFGVGAFAQFLKTASKRKKAEGADNLRRGRELFAKIVKDAAPVELDVRLGGKPLNGSFLGVEVMNIPFTGPALPFAVKAHAGDGLLDVICFEADRRKEFIDWLGAPQDEPAPILSRQTEAVELTWADAMHRLDDEAYDDVGRKQIAEIACEDEQLHLLIPVKHPAQQAQEKETSA